jgi:hypothetical protein
VGVPDRLGGVRWHAATLPERPLPPPAGSEAQPSTRRPSAATSIDLPWPVARAGATP